MRKNVYGRKHRMIVRTMTIAVVYGVTSALTLSAQGVARHAWLRIGLITADSANATPVATAVERGVRLGASGSKQTAALFGDNVDSCETDGAGAASIAAS